MDGLFLVVWFRLSFRERQILLMPFHAQRRAWNGAFAIVKAARRESLGIIKEAEICSEKISTKIKVISTFKHIVKTIKEQIFTILLIIFTVR